MASKEKKSRRYLGERALEKKVMNETPKGAALVADSLGAPLRECLTGLDHRQQVDVMVGVMSGLCGMALATIGEQSTLEIVEFLPDKIRHAADVLRNGLN